MTYLTSRNRRTQLGYFARRLADFGAPLDASLDVLEGAAGPSTMYRCGADLTTRAAEGLEVMLSGWACTMWPDEKRTRQIFSFLLPGDVLGSFWRQPEFTFWRVSALTPLVTAPLGGLLATDGAGRLRHGLLVKAGRRAEDYAHHIVVDHMSRLGVRDAYGGLSHLLLELHGRLAKVGLAEDGVFHLPVGQRVLAQAMGFSLAHTNQTLQRLVADGLLMLDGEIVHLTAPEQMARIANFTHRHPRAAPSTLAAEALCDEP